MTQTTNTIEINGKRYDTRTGRLLEAVQPRYTPTGGGSIDGLLQSRTAAIAPTAKAMHRAPITAAPASHSSHKAFDIHRLSAASVTHHKPQHSTTLMRKSVSKPGASLKRMVKVSPATTALVQQPRFDIVPKQSVTSVDEHRLKHAHQVARSNSISRFGVVTPKQRPVVRRPIEHSLTQHPSSTPVRPTRSAQPSNDIFERALATANSHQQPHVNTRRKAGKKSHKVRTFAGVTASSLAILLIVGFVAYLNETSLQMHLASSRAGISATLPKWRPQGFSVGSFAYAPSTVTVNFKSADQARTFSLTQTASNWDSSALLSDYVLPHADTYTAVQSNGNTIYTFGNNDATWVSGGIWYQLNTNGNLSTSEIVELAASM